ncbi:unnamed protein product [Bursaphelenchus xylophilus]|uniref:(pine wood nematode) hypothetical protein n=1 Tax=Bursaphelenchus xylophilus TaxID=6326 RepID=A0A7I8X156_BURXY|nr:unnamed protein product [Bursaphelenchus xylophilus]CAG9130122.1 unnamed protein product [Bursaphelenchus xylophilus]
MNLSHPITLSLAISDSANTSHSPRPAAKLKAFWSRLRPRRRSSDPRPCSPEPSTSRPTSGATSGTEPSEDSSEASRSTFGGSPPEVGVDVIEGMMGTLSARMDPLDEITVVGHKRSICGVPENEPLRDLSSSSATTTDSAVSSTGDPQSRRSSSGFQAEIRPRRSTINSRMPVSKPRPMMKMTLPTPDDLSWRKISTDSQFDDEHFSDDDFETCGISGRRMSVDERTLRKANYAILRKNVDRSFEIVGAFKKHQRSAYKNYLQSFTAYDITPSHGILFTIDSGLTIRKTIHAMCAQSTTHRAAMVSNQDGSYNIFTISDFLFCLQKRKSDPDLGDQTVAKFSETIQSNKRLVTASSEISVWDLARQFRINHVHRIPIMEVKGILRTNELFCLLSLRPVFLEIIKLVQTKCCLSPNLAKITLDEVKLGKWSGLATIPEDTKCSDAIDIILEKKVACLPLLDSTDTISGVFCKYDVLAAVAEKGEDGIDEILEMKVKDLIDPTNLDMLIEPNESIFSAILRLTASQHQCVLICRANRLLGVVSYADIIDFLANSDRISGDN